MGPGENIREEHSGASGGLVRTPCHTGSSSLSKPGRRCQTSW